MKERSRTKVGTRGARSSDLTRARTLALAAVGAAAGAAVALVTGRTPSGSERALARPHADAKVACATCHEATSAATSSVRGTPPLSGNAYASSSACKTCHAAPDHASVRAGHRALAARGALTCATCHPAHEGAQGVTFGEAGSYLRWGAGPPLAQQERPPLLSAHVKAGTTVPLVALSVCATCHDPTSARDPIAACVSAGVRGNAAGPRVLAGTGPVGRAVNLCFDEHRTTSNAEGRLAAWEAAREVAIATAWVAEAPSTGSPFVPLGGALSGALAFGASAAFLERRRQKQATASVLKPAALASQKRLPVINTGTCLGCYACVDACPFDVLAIERYVAVVARPDECCGVVLCEQVCPNGSLTIAVGEPVLDRPSVTEQLESTDVPGLFIAGDLTGLPLIKNAINQGVRAIDRIAETIPRKRMDPVSLRDRPEPFDVLVIGAGPAGLSAALRAKEKNLTCLVLEQATVAASVKSFPRDKIVYDPPLELPVEGELWMKEASKEELVAQWSRIVRARAIDVREGRRVTAIDREKAAAEGAFVVTATTENATETYRACRVVLAIGRRGTPRLLDLVVEPGAESRISYALADARSFAGKSIVVAGLGDTAMEAAIALARQPETAVSISYRGSSFARGKARNIAELQDLVAKGRLRILFETVPVAVGHGSVTLGGVTAGKGRRTLRADALLVLVGGVPSWDLLSRAGIRHPGAKS